LPSVVAVTPSEAAAVCTSLARLQHRVLRLLFLSVALLAALRILSLLWVGDGASTRAHAVVWLGYGAVALLAAYGTRLPLSRGRLLMGPLMLGGILLTGLIAVLSGWSLQTPGLMIYPLLACLVYIVGSRLATALVASSLAVLLALAAAEALGGLTAPQGGPPLALRLLVQVAAVLVGAVLGRAVAGALHEQLLAADAREQRFQALLSVASSAYWETDGELRLTQMSWRDAGGHFVALTDTLGRLPWDTGRAHFLPADQARMRASMLAREPLVDLPFVWHGGAQTARHGLISGRPRLSAQGDFAGYWGVARDVSAEQQARQELRATEFRYQQLFNHTPSPLTLHQGGIFLDVNPGTVALLEAESTADLVGHSLIDEFVVPEQRQALRERVAGIEALPPGAVLPSRHITLRTCKGRLVTVKSIGARTDVDGRPAVLSISIDETERLAVTQALERSQALLSRVVSSSPDIITLSTLPGGRYVMVNESFTRLLGYSAEEALGRSSVEVGIWQDPADRRRMADRLDEQGVLRDQLFNFLGRDGRRVPLLVSAIRFDNDGQNYLLTSARDISAAARARLERVAILDNASVGIAFTRRRRFELANSHFETLFGWAPGTLIGQPGRVVWSSDAVYDALDQEIGPALARGEAVDVERLAQRQDGSPFLMRMRAKAIDPEDPAHSGTIWIAEDVTAQRRADQALARALDAAQSANRAKSDFLANTSHEIRTPLNGLTGLARLACQPGVAPDQLRQYVAQISESAQLLSVVISDILDLSKIEAGKFELESAPFDLQGLLHSLKQAYGALAGDRGLAFEARLDPGLPQWVGGDALRVRQILSNFLHNALKFTASGGIVLVAQPLADGRVRFEVQDSGPGIDAATQRRLFQPFTQADESTTRRYGGTGLGLSICHALAELMGGRVGLHSTPGQGSAFFAELRLPAERPPAPVPAQAALDHGRLRGARVLLVEDNPVNMMIGVFLLEDWGVQVTQASNGRAALAAVAALQAQGLSFAAVLMDLQMPDMSGHEVTRLLRQQHSAQQLPVLALTAAALVSERELALVSGMNAFITKPVDPDRLRDALLGVLGPTAQPADGS
jgi:PAS domain S-box-containing protein